MSSGTGVQSRKSRCYDLYRPLEECAMISLKPKTECQELLARYNKCWKAAFQHEKTKD